MLNADKHIQAYTALNVAASKFRRLHEHALDAPAFDGDAWKAACEAHQELIVTLANVVDLHRADHESVPRDDSARRVYEEAYGYLADELNYHPWLRQRSAA